MGRDEAVKIRLAQAREIRSEYRAGTTQAELAARYGVSQTTISMTVRGRLHRDPTANPESCPRCGYHGARGATVAI